MLCLSSGFHFGASLKTIFGKESATAKREKKRGGGEHFQTSSVLPSSIQSFFIISLEPQTGFFCLRDLFSEKEAKFREVKKCIHCHTVNGKSRT